MKFLNPHRNQRGAALLITAMAFVVFSSLLFTAAMIYTRNLSANRGTAQRLLYVQEVMQNAAVMLHDGYLLDEGYFVASGYLTHGCPSLTYTDHVVTHPSAPSTYFCLPTVVSGTNPAPGCIANPVFPNNPSSTYQICPYTGPSATPSANGTITFAPPPGKDALFAKLRFLIETWDPRGPAILPNAYAQATPSRTLPPMPGNAAKKPVGAVPITQPCTSVPAATPVPKYACMTIKVCMTSPTCADSNIYYQSFYFPD